MGASNSQTQVFSEIAQCRLCENRFATSVSAREPRPIVWASPGAKVLIVGQAPGIRVHESGQPFTDRSGDR
jgi:uracil-DNA glycosylase